MVICRLASLCASQKSTKVALGSQKTNMKGYQTSSKNNPKSEQAKSRAVSQSYGCIQVVDLLVIPFQNIQMEAM